jgi:DNA-binding NarL/FixJ family response regulator
MSDENGERQMAELSGIADAAGSRLRADAAEDHEAARSAGERLLAAVTAAMAAGYPLGEIAAAEARGQDEVRRELRSEALERVERSGHHAREAQADHHRAIARAVRLGLSTREIAVAAQVTHSTIRSINNRYVKGEPHSEISDQQPSEHMDQPTPAE